MKAIANYTSDDFRIINGLARHEVTEKQVKTWDLLSNMNTSDMIEKIESGLSKFELKDDIIVHRTCETDIFESLQRKAGSIFIDQGFLSTSVEEDPKAGGNVFLEIAVPKGIGHGAWIHPLSGADDEYEFLSRRGGIYEVVDYEQRETGHYFRVKLVGFDPRPWSYATKEEVVALWERRGIPYDEIALSKI